MRDPTPGPGRDLAFRELADSVPVLIWTADAAGRCTYLNRRWTEFTGRPLALELDDGWREGVHPDDLPGFLAAYRRAVREQAGFEAEYRLRAAGGEHRWVLDRGVPVREPDGRFAGYVGACVDITDRRRAADALRASEALLDTIIERAPVGFALFDDGMRYLRVNGTLAEINGLPPEAHVGRRLPDLLPDIDPQQYAEPFRRVLESGEAEERQVTGVTPASAGAERHWLTSWYPVRAPEGDRVAGVGVFVTDITARVRAERGLRLLSDVGEALDAALGVEERLARLADLLVPALADFCTIDLLDAGGRPRLVASAHRSPEGARLLAEYRERRPGPEAPFGIGRALRTGGPELRERIPSESLADYARHAPAGGPLLRLGPRSAIVTPLTARGRVLGALALALGPCGRTYDGADLDLARQLGRRAGLAVDNARLYEEQSRIAHTLQRSLLPPELPTIPGIDAAARFSPMGEGNEVGGDFYDVFAAGASWAAVIGDVCGKGADAAALTALARHAIRALSRHDPPPSRVLTDLNEVILRDRGPQTRFSTVLYARLTPGERGVAATVASAGHPLPLLVRAGGAVERLGRPGTLLGPFPAVRVRDDTAALGPGDALVLYTDGVTEARRGGEVYGEARLRALLAARADATADDLAAAIEADVTRFQGGPLPDDLAVVVLRVRPGARPAGPAPPLL